MKNAIARSINMTAILLKYCYFNQSHELKIVWVHVCNQGMTVCNDFSGQVMKINPFRAQKMSSMAITHFFWFCIEIDKCTCPISLGNISEGAYKSNL